MLTGNTQLQLITWHLGRLCEVEGPVLILLRNSEKQLKNWWAGLQIRETTNIPWNGKHLTEQHGHYYSCQCAHHLLRVRRHSTPPMSHDNESLALQWYTTPPVGQLLQWALGYSSSSCLAREWGAQYHFTIWKNTSGYAGSKSISVLNPRGDSSRSVCVCVCVCVCVPEEGRGVGWLKKVCVCQDSHSGGIPGTEVTQTIHIFC